MRKLVLIFGTLVVLVGAFTVYFLMQSKLGPTGSASPAVDQFADSSAGNSQMFKPGSEAWSKQFDKQGNLNYQFKCEYYDPQPDGTVKVTAPVIQIFLSGGQMMQISGKDGVVQFSQGVDKGMMSNSPAEPPRYGTLRDVVVKLFNSLDAQSNDDAQMTMTMTNAQFDNDTYRLFTQEYVDETGRVWREDEIPVTVSAKDYAFTGSGMVLYWNDIDKRLKSLQIDHGKDLTLMDAGDLSPKTAVVAAPAGAASDTAPAGGASPQTNAPMAGAPAETRQRYTATFYENVRVFQGKEEIVKAARMDVDFAAKADDGSTSASPPVATPAVIAASQPSVASTPATKPAAAQPIHIYWNGPMRMIPTNPAAAGPLDEGKAIVRLTGSPVIVHQIAPGSQQMVDAIASHIEYHTADSSARLRGNVILKQTRPDGIASTVAGQEVNFSRSNHLATFTGPGKTEMPDPNDPKSVLVAAWANGCDVHFYDLPGDQMEIRDADLEGDVSVDHPRFNLSAQKDVKLTFDEPAAGGQQKQSSPPLRQIVAEGDANCVVHDAKGGDRKISGEKLTLTRDSGPDGKLYARQIVCEGAAHAEQADESISAGSLTFDLLPTTRKSEDADELGNDVALDKLVATEDVVVNGKDGSGARADELRVKMVDDQPHVHLWGSIDHPAVVKNKTSTITGSVIQLDPHNQFASINGPGSFDGIQQPTDPKDQPRPVNLKWKEGASLDGKANQATVSGGVTGGSDDGNVHQSFQCDRVVATLMDVASKEVPTTRKSDAMISGDANFMRNKQIENLSLQGAAGEKSKVESFTHDASGNLLNQRDLLAQTIDIGVQSKSLSVDGPGDILSRDAAPASTQPAGTPNAMGGAGQTAIDWKKRFVYDDASHQAEIKGEITIVHQETGPKGQSVRIDHAETVHAIFNAEPTTKPAKGSEPAEPKLKQMVARGPMVIRSGDKTIYCGELDFDPATQTLDCRKGQLAKVTIVDNNNLNGITYDEASLDLKTNELIRMTNATGQGQTLIQNQGP